MVSDAHDYKLKDEKNVPLVADIREIYLMHEWPPIDASSARCFPSLISRYGLHDLVRFL